MRDFRFRLERVLQYRQTVRQERKRELMMANTKLANQQERLSMLEQAALSNNLPQGGISDVNEFLMRGLYATRIKDAMIMQRLLIIEVEKEVEEARARYVEAAKDARALEMLKDKKKKDHAEYIEKEEGKILDEMVTQRISRLKQRQETI